jgi:hypothetical protein
MRSSPLPKKALTCPSSHNAEREKGDQTERREGIPQKKIGRKKLAYLSHTSTRTHAMYRITFSSLLVSFLSVGRRRRVGLTEWGERSARGGWGGEEILLKATAGAGIRRKDDAETMQQQQQKKEWGRAEQSRRKKKKKKEMVLFCEAYSFQKSYL